MREESYEIAQISHLIKAVSMRSSPLPQGPRVDDLEWNVDVRVILLSMS